MPASAAFDYPTMRRRVRTIETRMKRHRERGTEPTRSRLDKWERELEQIIETLRKFESERGGSDDAR